MEHLSEPASRAQLDQLTGLTWRAFVDDDLPAIASMLAETEEHDDNPERTSLQGLREYLGSPRTRPAEDTLSGWDAEGRVVAVAQARCGRSITDQRFCTFMGAVHPDRRGEGIGRRVLAWQVAHARAWDAGTRQPGWGPLTMRLYAPGGQQDARDLAERFGLAPTRWFFEMERPLPGRPGGAQVPEVQASGVRIVDWDAARSDEVLDVLNQAFRDHWGHPDTTPDMWADDLASERFRSDWSLLALDAGTGAVVGAAVNAAYQQDWTPEHREGYTDELGVLRSHRHRGVASALLAESMRRFAADGMDAASLGVDVDNPNGALRLYESLGYRTTGTTCVHELQEGPGVRA